jgi:hypothetical protein
MAGEVRANRDRRQDVIGEQTHRQPEPERHPCTSRLQLPIHFGGAEFFLPRNACAMAATSSTRLITSTLLFPLFLGAPLLNQYASGSALSRFIGPTPKPCA